MFIFKGTDYTLIVIGMILALFFFFVQLLLCVKCRKKACRFILLGFFAVCIGLDILIYAGFFGTGSGFIPANAIAALLIAFLLLFAVGGAALAWLGYFIDNKVK